uniref:Uncharacterized protein n=1 Tax=Myoviridae sp. ctu2j3 TaxID=2825197 RepID=A0A8S5UIL7_9CAUD|nr:MAG TPA: hypothetical protein [Myoviridae sp. ctu2j3]
MDNLKLRGVGWVMREVCEMGKNRSYAAGWNAFVIGQS